MYCTVDVLLSELAKYQHVETKKPRYLKKYFAVDTYRIFEQAEVFCDNRYLPPFCQVSIHNIDPDLSQLLRHPCLFFQVSCNGLK
jgi:hypothetical protein